LAAVATSLPSALAGTIVGSASAVDVNAER
jgi:hypothetical protein